MRPLKLHTKTTLLASAITVAVFVAALMLMSVRVAHVVREEEQAHAELRAINLAEHIANMPQPHDTEALARAAALVQGARPGIISVRIWERAGGLFQPRVSVGGASAGEIPEETKTALRSGQASRSVDAETPEGSSGSSYRVFAPIVEDGRLSGAVEVVEQLDNTSSIALRYAASIAWMALVAVALLTLATYLLFRQLFYKPIERLLAAMSKARRGDLDAEAPSRAPDELGLLSREFNRMIAQLREMTREREAQQLGLQERVQEATAELAQRNEQLEETNLLLWQTTRRLTELERLAAAGQTAAQLAHEVGTPLNLISGHVQLLHASLDNGDARSAHERLQTIAAQIERIERIVRRMLDRTRPEAVELAPLDLNALLRRIFDATSPMLEARDVRLSAALSPTLPLIRGDADRLQQVFINLVNNALDAMPDGGELRVSTSLEESVEANDKSGSRVESAGVGRGGTVEPVEGESGVERQVVVDFTDAGCGMTPEIRAHIFDPLYTTKARGRGTGLGLVVVNQVVGDHRGRIEVESEPGRGARFRLRFPVAPVADEPETERAGKRASAEAEQFV